MRIPIPNDPDAWVFSGNNPDEQVNAGRYAFAPLDTSLHAQNSSVVFWFVNGDERDTPTGLIEVASIGLGYRDESVLSAGAGARLEASPAHSPCDASAVTNGLSGSFDTCWRSGPAPREPQVFVWALANPVRVDEIRLFQDPLFPSRHVEIAGSTDGEAFFAIADGTLDAPDLAAGVGPECRILAVPDTAGPVGYVRLSILTGYDDACWGLDLIEVLAADV